MSVLMLLCFVDGPAKRGTKLRKINTRARHEFLLLATASAAAEQDERLPEAQNSNQLEEGKKNKEFTTRKACPVVVESSAKLLSSLVDLSL